MTERVRLEPLKHLRVHLGGKTIAETARGYVVHELDHPDRYYVPRADVRAALHDGRGAGVCPWKGKWKHLDVELDGKRVANLAWTYYETTATCDAVRDHVAFYDERALRIDVER